jgi:ABC-type bacteriocin/lantibiotic exporter with double-glycine peptidase domain
VKNNDIWPGNGEIIFNNVKMRYREGIDPVLKGVQFNIKPGE